MDAYEKVKAAAPAIMMAVKQSQMIAAKGDYDEALKIADKGLDALNLVEEYPDTLAAYVVASSAIQNYMQILDQISPQAVVTAGLGSLKAMAPFLSRNSDNENCAAILLSVIWPCYMNMMNYMMNLPMEKYFVLSENERNEAMMLAASQFYASFRALKIANPNNPLLQSLQQIAAEIPQEALLYTSASEIPEHLGRLSELYDRLVG